MDLSDKAIKFMIRTQKIITTNFKPWRLTTCDMKRWDVGYFHNGKWLWTWWVMFTIKSKYDNL